MCGIALAVIVAKEGGGCLALRNWLHNRLMLLSKFQLVFVSGLLCIQVECFWRALHKLIEVHVTFSI